MVEAFEKKVVAEWDNTPISGTRFMAEIRDAIEPRHPDRGRLLVVLGASCGG